MYRIYLGDSINDVVPKVNLASSDLSLDSFKEYDENNATVVFTDDYFNNMKVGEWIKLWNRGSIFSPRTGHECIMYKKKIYLFAGTDEEDRKNDLYCYDLYTNKWDKML